VGSSRKESSHQAAKVAGRIPRPAGLSVKAEAAPGLSQTDLRFLCCASWVALGAFHFGHATPPRRNAPAVDPGRCVATIGGATEVLPLMPLDATKTRLQLNKHPACPKGLLNYTLRVNQEGREGGITARGVREGRGLPACRPRSWSSKAKQSRKYAVRHSLWR